MCRTLGFLSLHGGICQILQVAMLFHSVHLHLCQHPGLDRESLAKQLGSQFVVLVIWEACPSLTLNVGRGCCCYSRVILRFCGSSGGRIFAFPAIELTYNYSTNFQNAIASHRVSRIKSTCVDRTMQRCMRSRRRRCSWCSLGEGPIADVAASLGNLKGYSFFYVFYEYRE